MIGRAGLFQVISGSGLCVYTLDWVLSAGAASKLVSKGHYYLEFPGWTDCQSVETYIAGLRRSLLDEDARQALDTLFPPEAIRMMIDRLVGRFRPIVSSKSYRVKSLSVSFITFNFPFLTSIPLK